MDHSPARFGAVSGGHGLCIASNHAGSNLPLIEGDSGIPTPIPTTMNTQLKNLLRSLARPLYGCTAATVLLLSAGGFGVTSVSAQEEGAEVLTRGPVHEAFAETITFKPVAGVLVSRGPAAVIEELPPDQRPDGDNVTWIPGYWAWEDEHNEYLWVSGIWRNLPPGRQWMPGYWAETGAEFQWISGYWADASVEEVEYLPEPPASIEAGPNIKRPSTKHTWTPGNWAWRDTRYRWRPGYWQVSQPDWVWVPSHYVRSPRGYIYVDGYYDYSVSRRGMIFAPVRFTGDHYHQPGYHYRPSTVISLAVFANHLFLRPRQRHYYFGDYYAPEYRRSGYYSSHTYYSGGHGYDPIYEHDRWMHRDDDRWERRYVENYNYFLENRDERPPHTLAAFEQFTAQPDQNRRVEATFVAPLAQFVASKETTIKFTPVNEEERNLFTRRGREIREFGDQRKTLATQTPDAPVAPDGVKPGKGKPGKETLPLTEPVRVKIPRSPVVAKVVEQPKTEDIPPQNPEVTATPRKDGAPLDPKRPGAQPTPDAPPPVPGDKPAADPTVPPVPTPKGEPGDPRPRNPKTNPEPQPTDPKADPKVAPPKPNPKGEPGNPRPRNPKINPELLPPMPNPKMEPQVPSKRTPKVTPGVEPTPMPEPKTVPKVEPNTQPLPRGKRGPKVEPGVPPTVEPKVSPRVDPKVTPRVEPRQVPRVEPKVVPRVEPTPPPARVQPTPPPAKPQPAPAKGDPKKEDKDEEAKDKKRKN